MKTNKKPESTYTHGGGKAAKSSQSQALRRSVMACLLWEQEFYEDGKSIAERISYKAKRAKASTVVNLAIEARNDFNLRHAPLWLIVALCESGRGDHARLAIPKVVKRADELTELLALWWKDGKRSIPAGMKRGLAEAFHNFDEYQLAKYDRKGEVTLRDVMRLVHPKPKDEQQEAMFGRLLKGELKTPDTWETALSAGGDKKAEFERLLREGKIGYMALLRNLRNMYQAGVDPDLLKGAIFARRGAAKVLPFRFVAAARAVPGYEAAIDWAMVEELKQRPKLAGRTLVVVDVSGSMRASLSARSDMSRLDAACALGAIARELCEEAVIYATAGNDSTRRHATAKVPPRQGMALVDAIQNMQRKIGQGGIFLKQVMDYIAKHEPAGIDRVICITDEQDCSYGSEDAPSKAPLLGDKNYMINVASYQNGIGYGQWTHINGFSEAVFDYMLSAEK